MNFPPDRHGDNRWNRCLDALIAAWNRVGPDATLEALTALELPALTAEDAEGPDIQRRLADCQRRNNERGRCGMTWHCASCRTTVTWAPPVSKPGMTKCPRCDKWMDPVTAEEGAT